MIIQRSVLTYDEQLIYKAKSCVCLNSLAMMEVTKMENCTFPCNGSKKDPCGAATFFTIYEQHGIMSNIQFLQADYTHHNDKSNRLIVTFIWLNNINYANFKIILDLDKQNTYSYHKFAT